MSVGGKVVAIDDVAHDTILLVLEVDHTPGFRGGAREGKDCLTWGERGRERVCACADNVNRNNYKYGPSDTGFYGLQISCIRMYVSMNVLRKRILMCVCLCTITSSPGMYVGHDITPLVTDWSMVMS